MMTYMTRLNGSTKFLIFNSGTMVESRAITQLIISGCKNFTKSLINESFK